MWKIPHIFRHSTTSKIRTMLELPLEVSKIKHGNGKTNKKIIDKIKDLLVWC